MSISTASIAFADDCVILLHGLARTEKSMSKLADALKDEGYEVVNFYYPSRKHTIEYLAEVFVPIAIAQCPENVRINFVTHSMGGILLRQYLENHSIKHLRRVVMLGPPNQGSQVVDAFKNVPGFKAINGRAGMQLGTDESGLPPKLGPATFELGIIAGSRSINLILSQALPNPDDGKVSVENTKLEGMHDHIVIKASHPFLMKNKNAIRQVIHFLKVGSFLKKATDKAS